MALIRYLIDYIGMRLDGAGHLGAKQYAEWRARINERAREEMRGRP